MAYVAVRGGENAIAESIRSLEFERLKDGHVLDVVAIQAGMKGLIDQVMSESSLYDRDLAALALKQAQGQPEEAVFLLRAFRSTLPRLYYSKIADTEKMAITRRISAAFKDIPGGQILGTSRDYTHRLLDFDLIEEGRAEILAKLAAFQHEHDFSGKTLPDSFPKVVDYLIEQGLLDKKEEDDREPDDITKVSLSFPTSRSERLQSLTRGQTGAVTSFGYSSLRGYGMTHPTVGELRVGLLPIEIASPFAGETDEDDSYYIGEVEITEVETLVPISKKLPDGRSEEHFEVGYGICYGQNETKAIAMSILDRTLETDGDAPANSDEFVLYHIDSVESSGFISHLKLPHYVTFQAELDAVRKTKKS